ncbi:hypothetical protein NX801_13395 [Streptomyces sp. LP05-1]|uniref:Secreted protein n=1 Tax=Streptomyces pyxinae TaxID=2970734 RepID=A0ABT2CGV2_9ACTN|nr:hypothetical protein [Streptomyces sp. LP05-1]MCS0636635.1 hypothetical protein [Streptomyces sp. LP05-1]
MRTRPLISLSALAGLTLLLLLALAPGAGARASGLSEVAEALRKGPVYVHPGAADQLPKADADALAQRIKNADKPVFVAVLPATAAFPEAKLLQNLRAETGVTGLYAIRLGDRFAAGADRSVMPSRAVQNVVTAVRQPGVSATAELNSFVDQVLPQTRGSAPDSWSGVPGDDGGVPVAGLVTVGAVAAAGGATAYAVVRRNRRRKAEREAEELARLRVVVDEDITAFGEELDRLDFHPAEKGADDAMRADYERALDAYDQAKSRMAGARHPGEVRGVTEALEDGRFSLAVLAARREGRPLPERRAPCFFDPRHGPAATEAEWAPDGGAVREVPVCAADAARLRDGRDPMARTVETDRGRRPYWEAGPAYGPWAGGYFGGGMLPGLLTGTLLGSMLSTPAYAADYGGPGFDGGDYAGGDFSGGDFNPSDFGGGFGDGGGFGGDGGGFGGGGGDFGGGGF